MLSADKKLMKSIKLCHFQWWLVPCSVFNSHLVHWIGPELLYGYGVSI